MTTRDSREQASYVGQAKEEIEQAPTVFRDGFLRGRARGELWPPGKPAHFS